MPRHDHWQSSFAAGELTPLLAGRPETQAAAQGLASSLNGFIGPHGQWMRRPGTLFRHALEADQSPVRLVNFAATTGEAFILLFYHQRCEVFAVDRYQQPRLPEMTFITAWSGAELEQLSLVQSANTLIIAHPRHAPQKIAFTGTAFVLTPLGLVDGPYLSLNLNPRHQFNVSGTWLRALGFSPFVPEDAGRSVRVFDPATDRWHNGIIQGIADDSAAAVVWDPLVPGSSTLSIAQTADWYLGAFWSDNYPALVALHDDRLVFANTASNPQSFWMSVPADYSNFAPSDAFGQAVTAASAIFGTLNDATLNQIHWLAAADYSLLAATVSGVWRLFSADGPLSAQSIQARKLDAVGAAQLPPVVLGDTVIYADRSSRQIMALSRDGLSADLSSRNLSLTSAHLLEAGVREIMAQQGTALRLWVRLADDSLVCLDHSPQEQQLGWTRQQFAAGASTLPAQCFGMVVASRPSASGNGVEDQAWFAVARYRDGQWRRSLEVLTDGLAHDDSWAGHFLDSGVVSLSAFPVSVIDGLEHLEGEWLRVRSVEQDMGAFLVEGGRVELPEPIRLYSAGLAYTSAARVLDFDAGTQGGFSLTKSRHLYDARFRLWRSGPFEVGTGEPEFGSAIRPEGAATFWPVPSPEPHHDQPFPGDFTGDVRVKRDEGGWARATALSWRTDAPFALNILGLGVRLAGGD